jgi:hypothetical protein
MNHGAQALNRSSILTHGMHRTSTGSIAADSRTSAEVPAEPLGLSFWTESSTGADTDVLAAAGNAKSPFPPGTPRLRS